MKEHADIDASSVEKLCGLLGKDPPGNAHVAQSSMGDLSQLKVKQLSLFKLKLVIDPEKKVVKVRPKTRALCKRQSMEWTISSQLHMQSGQNQVLARTHFDDI